MEYVRITSIKDPLFAQIHELMRNVFPPEEVLAFDPLTGTPHSGELSNT